MLLLLCHMMLMFMLCCCLNVCKAYDGFRVLPRIYSGMSSAGADETWPYHKAYAKQNEGYAQQLTYVDSVLGNHLIFGFNLHIFYVFYDKSGKEYANEEHSHDEIWPLFCIFFQYIHIRIPKRMK